ncbi:hypothetical protein [Roseimaritima ulvae]|uniref:Uncharacterized protein n=1 Tax=Roseimaritima ulvae TaxID=980254 RepID=A0A5B9QVB7_9BACT|nr:hypothetical protein [Roseimaritima ulvae]QEG41750.1 hypothetical protein UC8_37760 [Roseimaritima ulvae]
MSVQCKQRVEFFGGPIDGQVSQLETPLKPFVIVQTLAHARHVNVLVQLFRVLFFYEHTEPPVRAVYELQAGKYTYLRSTIAIDMPADAQRVCAMIQEQPPILSSD